MSNTMFVATHDAGKAITRTFDMVWPLVAGLWNIRQASKDFFVQNPNASNKDAKRAIISGLNVRGLDFRGIFENYTWKIAGQKTLDAYKTILDEGRTAI